MSTTPHDRSTFYNSFVGTTKNKFDNSRHRKHSSIAETSFFSWTQGNMYRTSYNDMANKVSGSILNRYISCKNSQFTIGHICRAKKYGGPQVPGIQTHHRRRLPPSEDVHGAEQRRFYAQITRR